jgi:hypothetical protein
VIQKLKTVTASAAPTTRRSVGRSRSVFTTGRMRRRRFAL